MTRVAPLLFWLLAGLAVPAAHATTSAKINHTEVFSGETIQLQIETDQDGGEPDLTILEPLFSVTGRSESSQISMVNGAVTRKRAWTIGLRAKQEGRVTIPAISVGSERTQPITITVRPLASANDDGSEPFLVEVEVDTASPYVQQQVIYTMRIWQSMSAREASITEPAHSDILAQRLGEDRVFEQMRHNQRYRVVERRYAIFPQSSGEITLDGPEFQGMVTDPRGGGSSPFDNLLGGRGVFGRDPFGAMLGRSLQVRASGPPVTLSVKPRPASATGSHWLPAQSVRLTANLQPNAEHYKLGEPITYEIVLAAEGLTGEQLPDIPFDSVTGAGVYPDQGSTTTDATARGVLGQRVQKMALLPNAAGELTLPALELPWWNTRTNRAETATLPARTLQIVGTPATRPAAPNPAPQALTQAPPPADSAPAQIPPPTVSGSRQAWIVATVALLLWLLTLLAWWWDRRRQRAGMASAGSSPEAVTPDADARAIKQACAEDDAAATRQALLGWARERWPTQSITSLADVARQLSAEREVSQAITELDRSLYSQQRGTWDGTAFWQLLQPCLKQSAHPADESAEPVAPLYPG
jgi:hypothetical protein